MKLTDLHPEFIDDHGRVGVALICDCPCGKGNLDNGGALCVPFSNPLDKGTSTESKGWQRSGETFETLTLMPSIRRLSSPCDCRWHGWIQNGEVITC